MKTLYYTMFLLLFFWCLSVDAQNVVYNTQYSVESINYYQTVYAPITTVTTIQRIVPVYTPYVNYVYAPYHNAVVYVPYAVPVAPIVPINSGMPAVFQKPLWRCGAYRY